MLAKIWPTTEKVWNNTKPTGYVKGIFGTADFALKLLLFLIRNDRVILPGFWTDPRRILEHFTFQNLSEFNHRALRPERSFETLELAFFRDRSRLHYYDPQVFLNEYLDDLTLLKAGLTKTEFWNRNGYPSGFFRPMFKKYFNELWLHKTNISSK